MLTSNPSCADDYDPNSLTLGQALERIAQQLYPIDGIEQVPIRSALQRVTAVPLLSPRNVPPHDYSMMDGYALDGDDLPRTAPAVLKVVGTSLAGRPCLTALGKGECVRIFTGAVLPTGTDTVVMQEHVEVQGESIRIAPGHQVGQHVCLVGTDFQTGQPVLPVGKYLQAADLGLLASLGIAEVQVKPKLQVSFLTTGDELCSLGQLPKPGQIYDSNRYILYGLLSQPSLNLQDRGVVADDPQAIEDALLQAAAHSDVIISSGGVSVGDADYVIEVLQRLGKVNFWKIAIKPGRPLTFGTLGKAVFFGLPGNPVAIINTFYQLVQPALSCLLGVPLTEPVRFKVTCGSDLRKRPGRLEFQRGILRQEQGQWVVSSAGLQSSGVLSSMSRANCFIVLDQDCGNVPAGSEVWVQLL